MRKSLEIDEQLLSEVERAARAKGLDLRDFVEQTLRAAIPAGLPGTFSQRVHDFGAHLESPWTSLAEIESEAYSPVRKKE